MIINNDPAVGRPCANPSSSVSLWHVTNRERRPLAGGKQERDARWELALSSSFIRCATGFIIFGNGGAWVCGGGSSGGGLDNDGAGSAESLSGPSGAIASHSPLLRGARCPTVHYCVYHFGTSRTTEARRMTPDVHSSG